MATKENNLYVNSDQINRHHKNKWCHENYWSSKPEVPNHWDAPQYRDLKKVQVGPEKLPNWNIYHSFDVTQDQQCTQNMTPGLKT